MKIHHTIILIIVALLVLFLFMKDSGENIKGINSQEETLFKNIGLQTNTLKSIIPLDEIIGGGPVKDGIPALTNPKFINPDTVTDVPEDSLGILVQGGDEVKFYPYTVLVWHEIVNDTFGDIPIAITFCPLCGSAIAFERTVGDEIYEFGVSGKLWQSNLLMYDRTTESLWSQIEGRAVVGDLIETELTVYPSQLLSFSDAKNAYPNMQVLSSDTGYTRNYGFYPYGNYEDNEDLIFPVNNLDLSLPAKTLMYASVINDEAVAFHREKLLDAKTAVLETKSGTITAKVSEDNEITITDENAKTYPGYVTMWFSWANHNDGVVWK